LWNFSKLAPRRALPVGYAKVMRTLNAKRKDFMKRAQNLLLIGLLLVLTTISSQIFAQETKTFDGVKYTVIDPATYAFNADSRKIKAGENYVIAGVVLSASGATLTLNDAGITNQFILGSPMKLEYGTKVTIYVKVQSANSYTTKANIIKIEGAGIPSANASTSSSSLTLDGKAYTVIEPTTYAFNADSGKLKSGERYVIDGEILSVSGATLTLNDAGITNQFKLNAPSKLSYGSKVRVYVELTKANSYTTEANVIKLENR
jgi:hypothetical protein